MPVTDDQREIIRNKIRATYEGEDADQVMRTVRWRLLDGATINQALEAGRFVEIVGVLDAFNDGAYI